MKLPINEIICGAMPEATKGFPDGSINCCISSPPYWALRDYGVDGQLGLEPTFEEYIDKLCTIYDEVKRVLWDDGTCWVNLGDTYACSPAGNVHPRKLADGGVFRVNKPKMTFQTPIKSLCLIPQRFAIEMVNRGWILRNVIIWHKPNPMPSSAKDRFTVDFEYVYFFVKSRKYWFEPQYEPHSRNWADEKGLMGMNEWASLAGRNDCNRSEKPQFNPLGRNKRTVWTIPTQPFPEAHFATFPEKLVEPMIKAGCPEFVCTKCGKAREKIWDRPDPKNAPTDYKTYIEKPDNVMRGDALKTTMGGGHKRQQWLNEHPPTFKSYTDCGCNADWRPGIVWDCFLWLWHDLTGSCKAAA